MNVNVFYARIDWLARARLVTGGFVLTVLAACTTVAPVPVVDSIPYPAIKVATLKPVKPESGNVLVSDSDMVVGPRPGSEDTVANWLYPASQDKDLWARIRKGFAIPDLENPAANRRTQWYARQPEYMMRMANRSRKYLYHIVTELEKRNMPTELALLPFVESAFNPQAISSAKAAGMWQFIPQTGRQFDLKQNLFQDDRRSVQAATDAALNYLQQLHDMFGDWQLALAAYNWGPGNVQKAIKKNKRRKRKTDYAHLRMPRETAEYIPKLQAIENIVSNPGAFGIELPEVLNHPYFQVIAIDKDMDVALAASLAEIPEEDFQSLNPSTKRPVILAETLPHILLPWSQAEVFIKNLKAYQGPLSSWTTWSVPKTMTQAQAARAVGMTEKALRTANGIKSANLSIRTGSTLLVHRPQGAVGNVAAHIAENAHLRFQPEYIRKTVRVRSGDTLSEIAAHYGVSVKSITRLNRISRKSILRIGQRLQVIIPKHRGGSDANGIVTVRKGDTLSGIAGRHGMGVSALARLNGLSKRSILRIGQRLKVAQAGSVR